MEYYIELKRPKDISSKKIKKDVEFLLKKGVNTYEIILACSFVAPDNILDDIFNKFRQIKNRIKLDLKPIEK